MVGIAHRMPMNSISNVEPIALAWNLLADDPGRAAEYAQRVQVAEPGNLDALLLFALCSVALGRHKGPMSALDDIAPLAARSPRAWLALGQAQLRQGRPGPASAALAFAARLQPVLPQAWLALADARRLLADDDGVDAALKKYLEQAPHVAELNQAQQALAGGDAGRAESLLRKRLDACPGDVAAIRMLAESDLRRGRHEGAEASLRRALELAPGFSGARQNLAVVLYRSQRHVEALEQTEILLEGDPDNPFLQDMKIRLLDRVGDVAGTIRLHEKMVRDGPFQPQRWLGLGHALKTAGRRDEAVAAYRRAIGIDPGFGAAWWSIANLKTVMFEPDDIALMQAQLQRGDLPEESRAHLEFALGKAHEDRGDYAASFAHYASGNRVHRAGLDYDATQYSQRTQYARSVYTRDFFAARKGGDPAPDPIFVVGMPRSGSTLVEQILSSHPQVEGTMELPAIIAITRELRARAADPDATSYHDVVAWLGGGQLAALGARYLERTRAQRREGRPFFIDKMPNNFAHIGLIYLILPNAKIIDARRHPLACCFSNFKQHFAHGQAFSYDLGELGRYYRDYVGLMAHFDVELPGRIHRVFYEDMVDDTEAQVRRLLDYCGLPFDERCLRFFENQRAVRTASSEQVRKPIFREGIDHWQKFEAWLQPLKDALGPVLEAYPAVPG